MAPALRLAALAVVAAIGIGSAIVRAQEPAKQPERGEKILTAA